MSHDPVKIWNIFKKVLPGLDENILCYRHHGSNSISLWYRNRTGLIFTYKDKNDWTLKPYNFKE